MGEMVGYTTSNYDDARLSAIFKNPKSLKNFERDVRAVSDNQGNLYVAQIDGDFVHHGFSNVIGGNANNSVNFMTWMRLGNTNKFAYSDSFMAYAQKGKKYDDIAEDIDHALQTYPTLILPGARPGVKEDSGLVAKRTIWAEDNDGNVLIIVTKAFYFSLFEIMNWMLESDLDINTAINLDGGPSTGIEIKHNNFTYSVNSAKIPNVISIYVKE